MPSGAEYAKDIYMYTRKSINPEVSPSISHFIIMSLVAIDTIDKI